MYFWFGDQFYILTAEVFVLVCVCVFCFSLETRLIRDSVSEFFCDLELRSYTRAGVSSRRFLILGSVSGVSYLCSQFRRIVCLAAGLEGREDLGFVFSVLDEICPDLYLQR